jgi:hypothetical protein
VGITRNGARSFLNVIQKACKLSRLPGFHNGIIRILGPEDGASILAGWEPFCAVVDALIAADDFFNKRDATFPDSPDSEDSPLG